MRRQSIVLKPFDKRFVGKWLWGKDWIQTEDTARQCLLVEKEFFHSVDRNGTYVKVYFDGKGVHKENNKFIVTRKPKIQKPRFGKTRDKLTPGQKRAYEDREGFRDVGPW